MTKGLVVQSDGFVRHHLTLESESLVDGKRVLEFSCPSDSHSGSVYIITLDVDTLEVDCPCAWFRCQSLGWGQFLRYGTDAEIEAFDPNIPQRNLSAQITRSPSGLCKHVRRIQHWLKRRGMELAISQVRTDREVTQLKEHMKNCGSYSN